MVRRCRTIVGNAQRNSSRRPLRGAGRRRSLRGGLARGPRRDLGPSLAQLHGFAHAMEKLRFAVVMLPAPAAMEVEEMRASALGEKAPFLRNLVECVDGKRCRHEETVAVRSSRRVIVSSAARASNETSRTGTPRYSHDTPESQGIIIRLPAEREPEPGTICA